MTNMPRIALVTCKDAELADLAQQADAPLLEACARAGLNAEMPAWNDPDVDWAAYDLSVVRTVWDYGDEPAAFRQWLATASTRTRLINPPPLLSWGLDKRYLFDLAAAGVPIIPTLRIPDLQNGARIAAWAKLNHWEELVVKPLLGQGGTDTHRIHVSALQAVLAMLPPKPAGYIAQPFYSSILAAGEASLIYIDGVNTHAVQKLPCQQEFRCHAEYGGHIAVMEPSDKQNVVAKKALAAMCGPATIARIDMVMDPEGQPRVIECEVVEPELFFHQGPEAADILATSLAKTARARSPLARAS